LRKVVRMPRDFHGLCAAGTGRVGRGRRRRETSGWRRDALSAAIRLTAQPSEIAGFAQFQTPGGRTALAKPEPVTVSGDF